MKGAPDCYACAHRRPLLGDAHSKCVHPEGDGIGLIALLRYGFADYKTGLQVVGDPYGISQGWFMWPINFDPVWLVSCTGFTPKEEHV